MPRRFAAATGVAREPLPGSPATAFRYLPSVLAIAAALLSGTALMEPVIPTSQTRITSRGVDIVIVLDLSASMQEEMEPKPSDGRLPSILIYSAPDAALAGRRGKTRLDATKAAIKTFVGRRHDDRIGLVVFSDHAYVASPLTFDHDYVKHYIDLVDDETLRGEGMTAIGDGLALANSLLARQSTGGAQRNQAVIVFTDGQNNIGREPLAVLTESDAAAIRVHMVGIALDKEVGDKPVDRRLVDAVKQHGGLYFNANTTRDLDAASTAIDRMEKGILVSDRHEHDVPVYSWFALPAFICLVSAMVLRTLPPLVDHT